MDKMMPMVDAQYNCTIRIPKRAPSCSTVTVSCIMIHDAEHTYSSLQRVMRCVRLLSTPIPPSRRQHSTDAPSSDWSLGVVVRFNSVRFGS